MAIIGAGPAGSTAAIRLLGLGRSVALIERDAFPRPHVGESLSPGVWEFFNYLNAIEVLESTRSLKNISAWVAWETREPRLITAAERGPGVIVDRGDFDQQLVSLAESRGAIRFQPAHMRSIEGEPGNLRISLTDQDSDHSIHARWIIDARGRSSTTGGLRVPLGPKTHGVWTEINSGVIPAETMIEATEHAWLWGSPLSNGCFRVMAFVATADLKLDWLCDQRFRNLLSGSQLFQSAASTEFNSLLKARSVTSYFHTGFWDQGTISVGESALALDPLSSSGVEKSMRLALQAAIAINTVLESPSSESIAREFYETRLLESAAAHTNWTQRYYAEAWPAKLSSFWHDRAMPFNVRGIHHQFFARLASIKIVNEEERKNQAIITPQSLARLGMDAQLTLSTDVHIRSTPCAVSDLVVSRPAVTHPSLIRPVAYLNGIEIVPLIRLVLPGDSIRSLLLRWNKRIPLESSMPLLVWMLENGILELKSQPMNL